jgi:hypothetical protein
MLSSHFAQHVQLQIMGDLWPLAKLQRRYVPTQRRERAMGPQTYELPRTLSDFRRARPELQGASHSDGRVWHCPS